MHMLLQRVGARSPPRWRACFARCTASSPPLTPTSPQYTQANLDLKEAGDEVAARQWRELGARRLLLLLWRRCGLGGAAAAAAVAFLAAIACCHRIISNDSSSI